MAWRNRLISHGSLSLCVALLVLPMSACGGDVDYTWSETGGSAGAGGTGGEPPWITGGTTSGGNPFLPSGGAVEPGVGGTPPFEEEECPYVAPPPTVHECDPLAPQYDCEYYETCLPYIVYPERADGCGSPGYGEVCWYAGEGRQGDLCTELGSGCAPGFMCVVGAAGGERCARICVPGQRNGCPGGLICGETDVLGYGVCY